jgi:oligogalacturonide lyase
MEAIHRIVSPPGPKIPMTPSTMRHPCLPLGCRPHLDARAGLCLLLGLVAARLSAADAPGPAPAANEPPTAWIDPDTGHRVVRLSREPGTASLYFHQNAYTPDGTKLIVTTPDRGIAAINLATRAIQTVVAGPVNVLVTGRKSGDVYYTKWAPREETKADGTTATVNHAVVYATNVDTLKTREVVKLPPGRFVASLNADETLLLGSYVEGAEPPRFGPGAREGRGPRGAMPPVDPRFQQANYQATGADGKPMTYAQAKELMLHNQLARIHAGPPHVIFTVNIQTGEIKNVWQEREWLNHLQFSPTDPGLILFCHEGPWHEVDRVWTIRIDGTGLTPVHARTMNMEIAGHEFFSADGRTIWYDLQTPRGEDFWLAGCEIATGRRTWYHLQRNEWSVHFNVSPDGTMFAGDGGDNEMVAHAPDGKWIYLFHPQQLPDVAGIKNPDNPKLIQPGFFQAERLVNMSKHDYRLEPNVTFSPDMKWIIFRSNMFGSTQVFAVEIAKAK